MKLQSLVLISIISLISISCESASSSAGQAKVKEFSFMTYNVENLFDTTHDKGKLDYSYLPLKVKNASKEVQDYCNSLSNPYYKKTCLKLDWSEKVLDIKIANISKVIKSYDNGRGPDIVAVQEVENLNALKMLRDKGLADQGYETILVPEGPDKRGIDVGLMSRFPLAGTPKLHKVNLKRVAAQLGKPLRPTRSILEVPLMIAGRVVVVFINHWPSQSNPDQYRLEAANTLHKAAKKYSKAYVIATGDFNTVSDDAINGIQSVLLKKNRWTNLDANVKPPHGGEGSHWYKKHWSKLDKVFVLNKKQSSKRAIMNPIYKSYYILNHDFMVHTKKWTDRGTQVVTYHEGVPFRFDPEAGKGYSDHLPVTIQFSVK